jgi:hypothetical protein
MVPREILGTGPCSRHETLAERASFGRLSRFGCSSPSVDQTADMEYDSFFNTFFKLVFVFWIIGVLFWGSVIGLGVYALFHYGVL